MTRALGVRAALLVVSMAGCVGSIDGSTGTDMSAPDPGHPAPAATQPAAVPEKYSCDPTRRPPEAGTRRLSAIQYQKTLAAILDQFLGAEAQSVLAAAAAPLAAIPADLRVAAASEAHGGYRRLDQTVQQGWVEATYAAAIAVAQQLAASPARLAKVVGACATDADASNDAACARTFIQRLGQAVQRRPLAEEDVAFYLAAAGSAPVSAAAVTVVVAALLSSPYFLYRVEHGDRPLGGTRFQLGGYELAARLSYALWDAPPDAELLAAAAAGRLLDAPVFEAQVRRLVADPRAAAARREMVTDWLWLSDLPRLDALAGDAAFKALAGDFKPTAALSQELAGDVFSSWERVVRSGGSLSDFLEDETAYPASAASAKLYGLDAAAAGKGVASPAGQRAGLLTRPALLASGQLRSRPVIKGLFIRVGLLCDAIPPPPNDVQTTLADESTPRTTRGRFEALTEQPGTACAGCHKLALNPLGFATESYDSLGRFRTEEKVFDAKGAVVATLPVDTRDVPQVILGDTTVAGDARELTALIDRSGKFHGCFARNLFRYLYERPESVEQDGCVLSQIEHQARSGAPVGQVLLTALAQETFRTRDFAANGGTP